MYYWPQTKASSKLLLKKKKKKSFPIVCPLFTPAAPFHAFVCSLLPLYRPFFVWLFPVRLPLRSDVITSNSQLYQLVVDVAVSGCGSYRCFLQIGASKSNFPQSAAALRRNPAFSFPPQSKISPTPVFFITESYITRVRRLIIIL